MLNAGLAFAPAIALVMTVLLAALCINLGIRFHCMRVFATLAAGTWIGGELLVPVGPLLWNVPWLSFVIAGLMAAALCLGFQVLSGYMSRIIVTQLDSLAASRSQDGRSLEQRAGENHLEGSKA